MKASELIDLLTKGIAVHGDGDIRLGESPFETEELAFVGVHRSYKEPSFILSLKTGRDALPEECGGHYCSPEEFGCGACTYNYLLTTLFEKE